MCNTPTLPQPGTNHTKCKLVSGSGVRQNSRHPHTLKLQYPSRVVRFLKALKSELLGTFSQSAKRQKTLRPGTFRPQKVHQRHRGLFAKSAISYTTFSVVQPNRRLATASENTPHPGKNQCFPRSGNHQFYLHHFLAVF